MCHIKTVRKSNICMIGRLLEGHQGSGNYRETIVTIFSANNYSIHYRESNQNHSTIYKQKFKIPIQTVIQKEQDLTSLTNLIGIKEQGRM